MAQEARTIRQIDPARARWIKHVLNIEVSDRATSTRPPTTALAIWRNAADDADEQVERLARELRAAGDNVLDEVADEIEAVVGSYKIPLMRALMDFESAPEPVKEKARTKALSLVNALRSSISADKHLLVADTTPVGVPVSLRSKLGGALSSLAGQLTQV